MDNSPNLKNNADVIQAPRYPVSWLIAALSVILAITFFPYLFGGKTFLPSDMFDTMMAPNNARYAPPQAQNHYPFDALAQTYPYKVETKEAIEKGRFSYWNPHIFGGYPEYAESMANNYDVFNIVLLWLSPEKTILFETILELLIAGIGMIFLLRFFGVNSLTNLIFASAYMLNSMFITNALHRWMVASFCWVPLVILMIVRWFYDHQKKDLLYASFFLAISFLGGNFQTSFFAVIIILIIFFLYPSKNFHLSFFDRFKFLLLTVVLSIGLSSIMWFPTLELLFQTLFRGGSLNSSSVYASYNVLQRILSFPLLVHLLLPQLFGNPEIFSILSVKRISGIQMIDFQGAIGFLPAIFAIWGCFVLWKRREIRPFIILVIFGIIIPLTTPLYSLLYHRFFIISTLAACVIGAVTLQLFLNEDIFMKSFARFFKWTKILFGGLVITLVALSVYISLNYKSILIQFSDYVATLIQGSTFGPGNDYWMLGRVKKTLDYYSFFSLGLWIPVLLILCIILVLVFYQKRKILKRRFLLLAFLGTLIQLIIFTRSWFPSIDAQQFPIYPANDVTTYLHENSTNGRFIVWQNGPNDPLILCRNGSNVYKADDIHGYESLTPRTLVYLYAQKKPNAFFDFRYLGLANVRYIVTGKTTATSPYLRYLYSADSMNIYENLLCKPRAYFAYNAIISENDSITAGALFQDDFDGSRVLFAKEDSPSYLDSLKDGKNSVHFDKSENEEVVITAETDAKGVFILTDTYYPGWKCYVNGKEQPIYRVNYCMRGIILDAGRSTVVFKFEPDIFKAGATINGIAILLWIAALIYYKRKENKVQNSPRSANVQ